MSGRDGAEIGSWSGGTTEVGAGCRVERAERGAPSEVALLRSYGKPRAIEIRAAINGGIRLRLPEGKWKAELEEAFAAADLALCACGDVDQDGVTDLCLGRSHGAHEYRATTWHEEIWILSGRTGLILDLIQPPESASRFACSLADVGDVDGDGRDDLAIGSEGAGFVISLLDGRELHVVRDPGNGDLGCIVGAAGDLDGDGHADFFVVCSNADSSSGMPFGTGAYFEVRSGTDLHVMLHRALNYDVFSSVPVIAVREIDSGRDALAFLEPAWADGGVCDCLGWSQSSIAIVSYVPRIVAGSAR